MNFHLISCSEFPLVLGYPWLHSHNPHIDWFVGTVKQWGPTCQATCIFPSSPSSPPESLESIDLSRVPECYHDLKPVFSKQRATMLPPHRPYDCPIDLFPGTCPPRGWIFSLSPPERAAMDTYIKDALAAGLTRPSTSPAGAGFFFVAKKDARITSLYRLPGTQCHNRQ